MPGAIKDKNPDLSDFDITTEETKLIDKKTSSTRKKEFNITNAIIIVIVICLLIVIIIIYLIYDSRTDKRNRINKPSNGKTNSNNDQNYDLLPTTSNP